MLILTRRIGETLVIGDNVQITVLGVRGNQVRIGVDAPKDVGVHRKEIYDRIQGDDQGLNEKPNKCMGPKTNHAVSATATKGGTAKPLKSKNIKDANAEQTKADDLQYSADKNQSSEDGA